jgi:AraC-like DNA-binding protein
MGLEFWKMRVWQMNFEVHRPIPGLPMPAVVVEEVQQHRSYRLDGRSRNDRGSQLSITLSGVGGVYLGEEHRRLTRGMAFLHNHCDPDFGYYFPPESREPWRFLWISMLEAEELVEKFNRRYGYFFELPFDLGIMPQLVAYQKSGARVELLAPYRAAQLVCKLLATLAETGETGRAAAGRGGLVTEAQELILRHLREDPPIRDIAAMLEVSREHLSRLFRARTGLTMHEYATNCKLEIAFGLLGQHRLSCKEIAEQSGFAHYAAFSRAVRKRTGRSPEALREKPPA